MKRSSNHRFSLRTLLIVAGVLALALFTQMTVSHAEPPSPNSPSGASTLGDFVWHDTNVNGVKDESSEWGSSGIDGVVVKLYLDDMDGTFEPGADDTLVGTLTTGDDSSSSATEHGWYDFVNITANGRAYWVEIVDSNFQSGGALEGYVYTGDLGNNVYNGPEPRYVYMGDPIMDYNDADFGYALPDVKIVKTAGSAADGDTEYINSGDDVVYHYTVTNTGETHLSNIVVKDDNGTPNNTGDDFTVCTINGPLAPNASQSCTYTVSNITADVTNIATVTANPTNSSGVDLPGADVTDTDDAVVVLYASLGDKVWLDANANGVQDGNEAGIDGVTVELYKSDGTSAGSTQTANGGQYSFDNLVPGDYYVKFTLPSGYVFSPKDQGSDDAVDSDADTSSGQTATTTLTSGENDTSWDAGVYQKASLGDKVWLDANANGVQDGNEAGIDGVTVALYKPDGTSAGSTQTANGGQYSFDNLVPGDYYVKFTLPSGYVFSPKDQGSDDAVDSDADTSSGQTATTTLTSGENDTSWDAGAYQKASIGDYVWWDLDEDGVQDAGEPGLKGVTVTLKDASGNTVGTTTTDDNGAYSFTGLEPGDYTVSFTKPGSDWTISPADQGGDDASDSDANPSTGETGSITMTSGETDNTVDAGMSIPSSYTITKENTTADSELTPGDAISFTITIKNTGKTWLAVLPLKDEYDTNYLTYVNANPASDDNNDDGVINWSDLTVSFNQDLAPGASFSIVVNFTAKAATDQLTNHQTINTATAHGVKADPDGPNGPNGPIAPLDDQSDDAPVGILNPVGEPMGDFSAMARGGSVQLRWQSESESNILGFNILRKSGDGSFERVNDSLIFAQNAGADAGASYRFVDRSVSDGEYAYQLEIVRLDGGVEYYGQASVTINQRY